MPSRKSRSRKTADKMAAYKAAVSRKTRSPMRAAPRTSSRTSPRLSPSTKNSADTEATPTPGSAQNKKVTCKESTTVHGSEPDSLPRHLQKKGSTSSEHGGCAALDNPGAARFDPDEVIPETPPREVIVRNRKRVNALVRGEKGCVKDIASDDTAKPSKKRKMFQTPPREEDRAVKDHQACDISLSPDAHVVKSLGFESSPSVGNKFPSDPYISDTGDAEGGEDELLRPPLPRAQNNLAIPSDGKISGGVSRFSSRPLFTECQDNRRKVSVPGATQDLQQFRSGLDVFSVSSAALSRMFDGFTAKVSNDIEGMRSAQLEEIRKVADNLRETVSREIRSIHGLFEMMSNGLKSANLVRTGSKMSLSEWERMMDGLTPYATIIFGKDLFSRLLCYNAPLKIVGAYDKYGSHDITDVERACLSAQTVLFRLQPADKKYNYSGDVGKLHSYFKFSVVQNAFFNVCRDSFHLFEGSEISREYRNEEQDSGRSGMSTGSIRVARKIPRPAWLGEGKVTIDHINQARTFIETLGQSRKEKVRQTPTPNDIACHGALRVYRQLGSHLHDGRSYFRVAFFQGVGYLLVSWHKRKPDIDQRSMKLYFAEGHDLRLRVEDVPCTEQCSSNADVTTTTNVDALNKNILRNIFAEWPSMILTVDHDVRITKGNGVQHKTSHPDGDKRVIHRLVNLIDVALDCCVEFCGVGSREMFLRTNKYALRCVMIFALLFKALCLEFMSMCDVNVGNPAQRFPEPTDVKLYGICLKEFIPGLGTQKSIMGSKCLEIPQSLYDVLNHAGDKEDGDPDEAGDAEQLFDMRQIQESAELGVCLI